MVQWLLSANIRWPAALVVVSTLVACGTTPAERRAETTAAGWRVVERVGEAHYSPPDAATWLAATTGQSIIAGSEVETGRGGRLIVATPERHISVGSASRFVLPRSGRDDPLEQRAGWLRYRVASAGARPFRVHTRSLDLEFAAAVLDVRVEPGGTAVTVSEGEVRLDTPDGLRHATLAAGQSAQANGVGGAQLALRRSPEGVPEAVAPVIVPAIQPLPSATVAPATVRRPADPAGPWAATLPSALDGRDQADPYAFQGAKAIELTPATAALETDRAAGSAARPGAGGAGASLRLVADGKYEAAGGAPAIDPDSASTGRRGKFERLTDGVIDGVQPVRPTWHQP